MDVLVVFMAALITAVFTGLGALPFFLFKDIKPGVMGLANAAAAGLMLGASIGLIVEGVGYSVWRLTVGVIVGLILINIAHKLIEDREDIDFMRVVDEADARKMLMVVAIMTAHSFAEGIGVGVAYGDGIAFGNFISAAIAIHNIPEGIAISLILIPRGVSVLRAAGWSIFSSLPQPLMAVLAFLFVLVFRPFLPIGLGLAAGAMIWMVFTDLLPEATEKVSMNRALSVLGLFTVLMLGFQFLIG